MTHGDLGTARAAQEDVVYPSDPLGLLESIPELERFLSDRRVRGGIERARPHDVYRALFWAWLSRRFPRDRETLAMLLDRRRLFLAPARGAPWMATYNGIGAKVYGEAERGADGGYIGTHYLVFLFIPVFPFGSYVMTTAGPNAYRFFGRAPFDFLHWLWNRLAVLAVIGSVIIGLGASITRSRTGEVTAVNGLPYQVTATLCGDTGGETVTLVPGAHATVSADVGDCAIAAYDPSGNVLDTGRVRLTPGDHRTVWNILGAAPIYVEDIVYAVTPTPSSDATIHCGRDLIELPSVDYFLVTPPPSVELRRGRSVRRSHVGIAAPEELDCLRYLLMTEAPTAPALAEVMARGAGYAPSVVFDTVDALEVSGRADVALSLMTETRARFGTGADALEVQMRYQDLMVLAGRRAELVAEFEGAAPEDADALYLRERIAVRSGALERWRALAARFPDHPRITLALAYQLCDSGAFAEGARVYDDAVRFGSALLDARVLPRAICLAQADRAPEALALLSGAFATSEGAASVLVAALEDAIGATLVPPQRSRSFASLTPDMQARWTPLYRVLVGELVTEAELAAIEEPSMAALVRAIRAGTSDVRASVTELAGLSPSFRRLFPAELEALVIAESERLSPGSSTALWALSALQPDGAQALADFVQTGTSTDAFLDLPRLARAAGYFARSRITTFDDAERARALAEARALDAIPSWLGAAERGWPAP